MKNENVFNINSNNLTNSEDLEVEGGAPRPIGFVYVENEYVEELEKKAKAFDEINKNEREGEAMNNTLEVKLLSENATTPERHHDTDAGFDIFASETKILKPQDKAKIKTDVAVNIHKGYVGLLTSRSGVSNDSNIVKKTGKIDAGFQGHMKINIKNDEQRINWKDEMNNDEMEKGYEPLVYDIKGEKIENGNPFGVNAGRKYKINKGDKLAQLVIVPIWTPELQKVDEFNNETARGQNGFGSTGI